MKQQIYYFLFLWILFFANSITAQVPANDNCSGALAISIGSVGACGGGVQTSSNTTVSGDITFASPGNPYIYQTACTGPSATQAFPANDVWYSFVATGYNANITVTSTFSNPNISVYAGSCASLGGGVGGCAVGSSGSATLLVQQLTIGMTYYIQVSGATGEIGTFSLTINNSIDCTDCLKSTSLTVNPLPISGAYSPNTTVNICLHVNQYNHVNTNWLHGVQLTFGSGWDATSLTTTSVPTSTSTGGAWAYYPTGIGIVNAVNWGPGWYWETVGGQNNPSNNFGDPAINANAGMWNFCISITTSSVYAPGADLSVIFNTSGDGESGAWTSVACSGDAPIVFNATGAAGPTVEIKELFYSGFLFISPNPTNGILNINFNAVPQNTKIEMYNSIGALVLAETMSNKNNTIHLSDLSNGIYFMKVLENNKVVAAKKIVKE